MEQECNLFCLFNKVPRNHKLASQRNLFECFGQANVGTRMTPQMQLEVFENWYRKDLAVDANKVWFHFYVLSGLVGLLLLFFCSICAGSGRWCCGCLRRSQEPYGNFYPNNP